MVLEINSESKTVFRGCNLIVRMTCLLERFEAQKKITFHPAQPAVITPVSVETSSRNLKFYINGQIIRKCFDFSNTYATEDINI